MRNKNTYIIKEDYVEIHTAKGDLILIDTEDFEKAKTHSWCISKTGYPVANIDHKVIKMHRFLLGITDPNIIVDHANGNPLDNRRANMRICTWAENSRNCKASKNSKSGHIGIRITPSGKYRPRISVNREEIKGIPLYDTLEEAIAARNELELIYHGAFSSHLYRKQEDAC